MDNQATVTMTHHVNEKSTGINHLSSAIRAVNTLIAGVRQGLHRGFYVSLIAGQVAFPVVHALPSGATFDASKISIATTGNTLTVNQTAAGSGQGANVAVINWNDFDISRNENVNFTGTSSMLAINSISGSVTTIAGGLTAGQNIVLINPDGLIFESGSTISVNSLVASGLTWTGNSNSYSGGDLNFAGGSGHVTVESNINAPNGIVLLGNSVSNSANLTANASAGSKVFLVAADSATVALDSNNNNPTDVNTIGAAGSVTHVITSSGAINAHNILLEAAGYGSEINLTGTVQATGINNQGGKIFLSANNVNLGSVTEVANLSSIDSGTGTDAGGSIEIGNSSNSIDTLTISNANTTLTAANTEAYVSSLDVSQASAAFNIITLKGTDGDVSTNGLAASGVSSVSTNSGVLNGTTGDDAFSVGETSGSLNVDSIGFTGVASVVGNGGADSVNGSVTVNASLSGDDQDFSISSINFTDVATADLNGGNLIGTASDDSFRVGATDNAVRADAVDFSRVAQVSGNGGNDELLTSTQVNAALTGSANGIVASAITFNGLSSANLSGGILSGTTGNDEFIASTAVNQVSASGIDFSNVSEIDALGGNDTITGSEALLANLSGSDNQMNIASVVYRNVENADLAGGTINGSSASETFLIGAEQGAASVADIQFTDVARINAGTGTDHISAQLATTAELQGSANTVKAADILFTGIESADLRFGNVKGTDGNDSFVVNANASQVISDGISFSRVSSVFAGEGSDSLNAASVVNATLRDAENGISASAITFAGIDNADLAGGALTGSSEADVYQLTGTGFTTNGIALTSVASVTDDGRGTIVGSSANDEFVINQDLSVSANGVLFNGATTLQGGAGQDLLTNNAEGLEWVINAVGDGVNSVGDFAFSQFEALNNAVGDFDLTTSLRTMFNGNSVSFGANEMTLAFDSNENVSIDSSFSNGIAISGEIEADFLSINTAGDINLLSSVNGIDIQTKDDESIKVVLVQDGDLTIRNINLGEDGVLILDSATAGTGVIRTETPNSVNFEADEVLIGTGVSGVATAGLWGAVGDNGEQLTFDVPSTLRISANTYVTPFFVEKEPDDYVADGLQTESLISSQDSVVTPGDSLVDFGQIDPSIFEAVSPYVADSNAVAGVMGTYASTETPSSLDTTLLAALLSAYEPTAAGPADDEAEEKKETAGDNTSGQNEEANSLQVVYGEQGEIIGVTQDYVFTSEDSLWKLAERFLGNGFAWQTILDQNPQIKDPGHILDGTIIKVIVQVSDEVASQIKEAVSSGKAKSNDGATILPESFRDLISFP